MKSLKVSKLLRKSYKIRGTLDILINTKSLVLFDNSKYNENSFNDLRKNLSKSNISFRLLNKDDLSNSRFSLYAKGPTVLMFSEDDKKILEFLLNYLKNPIKGTGDVLLVKFINFLSINFFKKIKEGFSFKKSAVDLKLISLLGRSKVLFGILVFLYQVHFLALKMMFMRNFLLLNRFKNSKKY